MERILSIPNHLELQLLFGRHDENLKFIEKSLGIKIITKESGLKLAGSPSKIEKASELINYLLKIISTGGSLKKQDILCALKVASVDKFFDVNQLRETRIEVATKGIEVTPKTKGQKEYIEAIKNYDIVFGIGPAGTGKTYLAMAMAVSTLKKGQVRRIILTRPALEAGESLGYLPGDMYEKISPYLRPLYDALYDMMEAERIEKYLEIGTIEVAPLAYMRGRTLNDAFIILDEAQNCTSEQMKMFLTRLGFYSKTVITGDITQSDLPGGKPLGLIQAKEILKNIEGIKFIQLTGQDVVRHELVQSIIEAYEKASSG
ncbi:MAG: PhoH family protein [Candidatus Omnitrophota bacterium]|nr:PhoH family protein [Candidatus Omnitrophota bacterium]